MANLVTVSEAEKISSYSHPHILYLLRGGKIKGRKSQAIWLVDLDSLLEYQKDMDELGDKKFTPKSSQS